MRVLFLMENYVQGGLDTFVINLLNHYPEDSADITLMINSSHPGLENISRNINRNINIELYSFRISDILLNKRNTFVNKFRILRGIKFYLLKLILPLFYFKKLVKNLKQHFKDIDSNELVIINGGYPGSNVCQAAVYAWNEVYGKQPVYNFHNFAALLPASNFEARIDRYIVNNVRCFISVSKSCASSLAERKGFENADIRYIYNGIEDPTLTHVDESAIINGRYCLILGTYESRKGHRFAIEAMEKVFNTINDIQLHCFGYGRFHEIEEINKIINKKKLSHKVFLHSFNENKFNLIKNCELMLVPSQSHESFGLTIIEAMAFSKPVVATNIGGIPEVVGKGSEELIIDNKDSEAFARVIIKLLTDEVYYQNIAYRCRERFENNFDIKEMVKKYKKLITND